MSDLLSPILYVIQNEVDAFWCFCGFMELVVRPQAGAETGPSKDGWGGVSASSCGPPSLPQHGNFEESQETMKRQLGQLLLLLRVLDPQLCDFLGECLCGQATVGGGGAQTLPSSTLLHPPPPVSGSGHGWAPRCLVLIQTRETSLQKPECKIAM